MAAWFPGDVGDPGGPGAGGLATRRATAYPPAVIDPAPQPGDAEYLPQRRMTMLSGHVFEAAVQPIGPVTGRFYGDAGDGEHLLRGGFRDRYPADAGRDLVADGGPRAQWSEPLWGMNDSATEYRSRYLVALDEPSAAGRPQFAPRSLAMRPSATAVPVRSFGEPSGVATRRTVAPGRVTRWNQSSLVWPEYGPAGGGG